MLTNLDYNAILKKPWQDHGFDVVYQPSCLQVPIDNDGYWDIRFPKINWTPNTRVIMHCQDFLNIDESGCRELKMIQNHFGKNADRVTVVTWHIDLDQIYRGPLSICYFPSHSFQIICNLARDSSPWLSMIKNDHRSCVFQSLNGIPRSHRCRLIAALDRFPSKIVSLGQQIQLQQWPYHTYRGTENEENFSRLLPIYRDCDINIVSETQYDYFPGIITEKTLFAFLSRQIPLVIGYRGIVSHLQRLGFDMFTDVIDTSYDLNENQVRVERAVELNRLVLEQGIDRRDLCARLDQNLQSALDWPRRMQIDYHDQCGKIIGKH